MDTRVICKVIMVFTVSLGLLSPPLSPLSKVSIHKSKEIDCISTFNAQGLRVIIVAVYIYIYIYISIYFNIYWPCLPRQGKKDIVFRFH